MDASAANTIKGRAPLRASGSLRAVMKKRGKSPGTLSYFYSAKNDRDIVLPTDLELCSAIDLEADEKVRSYDTDTARIAAEIERRGLVGRRGDVFITQHDGSHRLREVKYGGWRATACALSENLTRLEMADATDILSECFTEEQVRDRSRQIHDWLLIAPVLHETRWRLATCWTSLTGDVLRKVGNGPATLETLRQAHLESWSLVFAAAWRLTQQGWLSSDLALNPLSANTTLTAGRQHEASQQISA